MVKFFVQYSSNKIPKDSWVESMGFLFCNVEGDYYMIEDAIGMGSGTELDVQLSPMKFSNINEIESEHEGFIGGWWHTHPDLSLFFSETDIKNQVFYQQNNPDGLGIVFDHTMIDEDFLGFKIFRLLHQFSDEYNEVPYQLMGFTPDGLKECLELIGIDQDIIESLTKKYGDTGASIKIDFSKMGEPIIEDPLGDSEWLLMEADDLLAEDKIIDAIKKYKMACVILEDSEHKKEYAEIMAKLIKLLIKHNYTENAREEFEILKELSQKNDDTDINKIFMEVQQNI